MELFRVSQRGCSLPVTARAAIVRAEMIMVEFVARGRIAWILGAIFGAVLLVIGLVANIIFLIIVGVAFIVIAVIFLIASYVTNGRTD